MSKWSRREIDVTEREHESWQVSFVESEGLFDCSITRLDAIEYERYRQLVDSSMEDVHAENSELAARKIAEAHLILDGRIESDSWRTSTEAIRFFVSGRNDIRLQREAHDMLAELDPKLGNWEAPTRS